MKRIKGTYYVADCEHNGDINRDENYLRSLGCNVVSHYWDGHDCGDAYIEFTCNESDFVSLYKKLGNSASFDANINDYVKLCGLKNYKRMDRKELFSTLGEMKQDLSDGFWNRLPLHLFFEVRERAELTTEDIVAKCLSFLTKDAFEVIGYSIYIVDGREYLDMLIKTSYKNLDNETIGDNGIGDYCLGSHGWLDAHNIYGECDCDHIFCKRTLLGYSYELVRKVVEKVINKEPLMYKHQNYYNGYTIEVEHKDYFKNGKMHPSVMINNSNFMIKDPRFWVTCNK